MAGSLDKLFADMRAAQGLAPDPLQDQLNPAATVPSTVQAPELSMETSADIDAAMAGVTDLPPAAPRLDMAGLVDQAAPMPLPGGMPVTAQPTQALASESSSTKKVVGNRKYAQGGAPVSDPQLAAITASANPEAEGASQALAGLDTAQSGVEKATKDLAAIEAERAMAQKGVIEEDDRVRAEEMARQEQFQVEAEQKITAIDQEIKEFAAREPDPGRFWSSRSAGQKALYLITAALQAFSKPEEVPKVADVLGRFIDQDIKIQEDRLSRELSAAQGRGKSVRELITMGKEKDAAVYALRLGAVESLEKMLDADFRAKGASPKAELAVAQSRAALAEMKGKYFKEAADGERANREMIFKAEEARKARAFQRAEGDRDRASRTAGKADKPGELAFLNTKVYIKGPDGKEVQAYRADGSALDAIPLNPDAPSSLVSEVSKKAMAQAALARASADMYRYLEGKKGATDLLTDKQYVDLASDYAVAMRNSLETGVMTENDRTEAMRKVGLSIAPNGIGWTVVADVKVSPETVRTVVERRDKDAAALVGNDMYVITKPGTNMVMKPKTGQDIYAEGAEKTARSEKAERQRGAAELAGQAGPRPKTGTAAAPDSRGRMPKLDDFTSTVYYQSIADDPKEEMLRVMEAQKAAEPGSEAKDRLDASLRVMRGKLPGATPEETLKRFRFQANGNTDNPKVKEAKARYEAYRRDVDIMLGRDFVEVE